MDAVREVIRLSGEHTYEGGRRVIRIEQAEKMTPGAQNCLLKTLEDACGRHRFPADAGRAQSASAHHRQPLPGAEASPLAGQRGAETSLRNTEWMSGDGTKRRTSAAARLAWRFRVAADESYWQRRGEVLRDFFGLSGRSDVMRVSGNMEGPQGSGGGAAGMWKT